MRSATLRELRNDSSALARAAHAGEIVVITDRGVPIAVLVPHRGRSGGVSRATFVDSVELVRRLTVGGDAADRQRAELDEIIDPYVRDPYDRQR